MIIIVLILGIFDVFEAILIRLAYFLPVTLVNFTAVNDEQDQRIVNYVMLTKEVCIIIHLFAQPLNELHILLIQMHEVLQF